MATVMARCSRCGDVAEHGVRSNGRKASYCRRCQREYAKAHYSENRSTYIGGRVTRHRTERAEVVALIAQAKAKPCADCGVQYPAHVMQFDHVRGTKHFGIANAVNVGPSRARLLAEIEKCEVVCANCHAERTWVRRNRGSVAKR